MTNLFSRLDQVLIDMFEVYGELVKELDAKHGDDEDTFSQALVEGLETSLESAIDEQGTSPRDVAHLLSSLSEALEQLDPSAFDDEDGEVEYDLSRAQISYEDDDDDIDLDDDDDDDLDDIDDIDDD